MSYFIADIHPRTGFPVEEQDVAIFETGQTMDLSGDPEIQNYLEQVMVENDYQFPNTWEEAIDLFNKLKEIAGL